MPHRGNGLDRLLRVGQEERMRPTHRTGGSVALLDERIEQPTEVVTQLHDVFLGHGSLLSGGSIPKSTDKRNRCNRPLGELYEVVEPDPNRLTLNQDKLLIAATNPRKNLVLAQKTFSGDFVATV